MMRVAGLVCEDFAVHVGSVFALLGEDGTTMPLTLVEAEPTRGREFEGRAPFALLFRSSAQQVLPQGLYRFDHPVMGILDIGIGAVGCGAAGIDYEAVFN